MTARRILTSVLALGALACTAGTTPKVVSPDAPTKLQQQQQATVTLTEVAP